MISLIIHAVYEDNDHYRKDKHVYFSASLSKWKQKREVCTYVYLHLLVLKIHPTLKVITEKGFYEMLAIFITQMKQEINFCFYVHLIFILIIHELIIKG